MERWCASAIVALALLAVSGSGAQPGADERRSEASLLLRLHAEGPHAVTDCAETRSRAGRPLQGATADRSDSLDRLSAELGVRGMRAVFRRPDGRAFAAQRQALRRRLAGNAAPASVPDLSHVYRVRLADPADLERAVARFAADPHVAWAQPDLAMDLDRVPDDPFFASSNSWGQGYRDLWGLEHIRAPEAWDVARGEGVVVAVVDSGVDYTHPDLADNVWVNPGEDLDGNGRADPEDRNGVDDDGNGYVDDLQGFDFANSYDGNQDGDFEDAGDWNDPDPFDDNGHGTHVAGTVAAVGDNGLGVIGVAPRARIMALKGFPASGGTTIEILARAMVYAIENGARVINNSWSCSRRCPSNPIAEEVVALAAARGVVVVTSAGNRQDDVVFYSPEKLRETIVVGASDSNDAASSFSNRGLLMDVVAPGSGALSGSGFFPQRGILSLLSSGAGPAADGFGVFVVGDDYLRWAGTSMSTPHVAGLVALLLSREPGLDFEGVRARVRLGVRDLGAPGPDGRFGAGLVDAARALTETPPDVLARFDAPAPGAILAPGDEPVPVRGRVAGADLAHWTLDLGSGPDPTRWQTLASDTAPVDGVLLDWDTRDLPDGGYSLRLSAQARDGRALHEFLVLSLERTRPLAISSADGDALRPRVSGERVVWESERPGALDEARRELGLDLYQADLARGTSGPLVREPGDQRGAALDGDRLVWLDVRESGDDLVGCEIGRRGDCRGTPIVEDGLRREPPVLSGERLAWTEMLPGLGPRLGLCDRLDPASCRSLPRELTGVPAEPALDGDRLVWVEQSAGSRLLACDLSGGNCVPAPLEGAFAAVQPLVDAGLVAWTLSGGGIGLLFACDLDPVSGACPARLVGRALPGQTALSGRRLLWVGESEGGSDLFLCELDPRSGACPVQRLTGSLASERAPDIDGDRVVWEDDRLGLFQIHTLVLPHLEPLADRRVVAGRSLHVPVRGHAPSGELALSAELSDGRPLAALGMQFRDLGHGRGRLDWRARGEGPVDVTFTGRDARGLATRHTLRIEVRPRPQPGRGARS